MKLEFKERRICLVTNYRTGSSFLSSLISDTNKVEGLGEYFGPCSYVKEFPFSLAFRNFNTMKQFNLKFMANHLDYDMDRISQVLNKCDRIIYLYRRDFEAQALSWVASQRTMSWAQTGLKEFYQHEQDKVIIRPPLPEDFVQHNIDILKNNYITMAKIYQKYPGTVYCLEDFEIKRPYQRKIIWECDKPIIEDFDVEKTLNFSSEKTSEQDICIPS
jgi:hypothetical protein